MPPSTQTKTVEKKKESSGMISWIRGGSSHKKKSSSANLVRTLESDGNIKEEQPIATDSPPTTVKSRDLPQIGVKLDNAIDHISGEVSEQWDAMCQHLEKSDNKTLQWFTKNFLRKLTIDAPIVVGFVFACVIVHVLNCTFLLGVSRRFLGIQQNFQPTRPWQYVRLVTHTLAHENLAHLRGNMTNILLVGPSAEKIFGSKNILIIILAVAVSSGFGHVLLGPSRSTQIGASGVVFALILLNSLVSAKSGKLPVSFVLTAFLWAGDEVWKFFFASDTVSHSAHLIGAVVGTIAGYYIQDRRLSGVQLSRGKRKWNWKSTKKAKAQ